MVKHQFAHTYFRKIFEGILKVVIIMKLRKYIMRRIISCF